MAGWLRLLLVCIFVSALTAAATLPGRQIYLEGHGQDAIDVHLRGIDVAVDASRYACVRCHGADGGGASEGGITAPPLTIARDMSVADTGQWLHAALVEGRGHDGRRLGDAMPAFHVSQADRDALAAYIRTLPYPAEPGIDDDEIVIGVDLTGTGLTPAGRSIAVAHLQKTADERAGPNGIFGRRPMLTDAAATDRIITLAWSSASPGQHPRFAIRAGEPTNTECDSCCGALHETVNGQAERLRAYLERQGRASVVVDSAQDKHPAASNMATAIIYAGKDAGGFAALLPKISADRRVYVFADAISPTRFQDTSRIAFVAPVDLQAQMAAVRALLRPPNNADLSPHGASVTIEMTKALDVVLGRMASQGRRISQYSLCSALAQAANAPRPLTIIHDSGQRLEIVQPGT